MGLSREAFGSKKMNDVLMIIGFVVLWLALQYVILPKLGVGT